MRKIFIIFLFSLGLLLGGAKAAYGASISDITPDFLIETQVVSITGSGFGESQASVEGKVILSNYPTNGGDISSRVITWSDNLITVSAPNFDDYGRMDVKITVDGSTQTLTGQYVYPGSTTFTSASPSPVVAGNPVWLYGKGFTSLSGKVTINNSNAEILQWTKTGIQVTVSKSIKFGDFEIYLRTIDGQYIPKVTGTIKITPVFSETLTTVNPSTAKTGDQLAITGTNLTSSYKLKLVNGSKVVEIPSSAIKLEGQTAVKFTLPTIADGIYDIELHDAINNLGKMYSLVDVLTIQNPTVVEAPAKSTNLKDYGATQVKLVGSLVKTADNPAVYLIQNDKRKAFPNQKVYESWFGNDFSTIKIISPQELSAYPLIGNVTYKPGSLIKIPSIPKVYLVTDDGGLRWITTEATFKELNLSFSQVQDLPEGFFFNYEIGEDI